MKYSALVLCLSVFLFPSCQSPKFDYEPKQISDGLMVGEIALDIRNFREFHGVKYREPQEEFVEVTFRQAKTNKDFKTVSTKNGIFAFPNLEEGIYYLYFLQQQSENMSNRSTVTVRLGANTLIAYPVKPGEVCNIGRIVAEFDTSNNDLTYRVEEEFKKVRDDFSKRYPESSWNHRTWLNTKRLEAKR